jgi:hypothetical protein
VFVEISWCGISVIAHRALMLNSLTEATAKEVVSSKHEKECGEEVPKLLQFAEYLTPYIYLRNTIQD